MIRLGTLFSGIGAIEQAFLRMGLNHEIVFACDNGEREFCCPESELNEIHQIADPVERERRVVTLYGSSGKKNFMELTYKNNYEIGNGRFFQDIRFLDGKDFKGHVDIIVGGSPCQAFSSNGKRAGLSDTRGTLFYEYARIIKEAQPRCFIFENVRGMLTHDKGRTWETVKAVFKNLNYDIHINHDEHGNEQPLLNSADFGIPQLRKRLFIIGFRKDIKLENDFKFPLPFPLTKTVKDFLESTVAAKYYLGEKGFEFVTTHPSRAQVGIPVMTCQKANQQFNWNGTFIFEELSDRHTEEILKKAHIGEWNGVRGVIRQFTPRECLRLMGFPDSFRIVVNDNMMWRQCGNSIVVDVLKLIMEEITKTGVFK